MSIKTPLGGSLTVLFVLGSVAVTVALASQNNVATSTTVIDPAIQLQQNDEVPEVALLVRALDQAGVCDNERGRPWTRNVADGACVNVARDVGGPGQRFGTPVQVLYSLPATSQYIQVELYSAPAEYPDCLMLQATSTLKPGGGEALGARPRVEFSVTREQIVDRTSDVPAISVGFAGRLARSSTGQELSEVGGVQRIDLEVEITRERLEVLTTRQDKLNTANFVALIANTINTIFVVSAFFYNKLERKFVHAFQHWFPHSFEDTSRAHMVMKSAPKVEVPMQGNPMHAQTASDDIFALRNELQELRAAHVARLTELEQSLHDIANSNGGGSGQKNIKL